MAKGGGHSKGQTKPYGVVRAWDGGKPFRAAHWTIESAEADMRESLRAANWRGAELDIRIIDRATGETVREPKRCVVCGERWATEFSRAGDDTLCGTCDEDDLPAAEQPSAGAALSEPLVSALRAKGLEGSAREDGTVTVTANDIDWTLKAVPHAVTGEPCGVWSAVGPAGSRGQFTTHSAADFIARRTTP